MVIESLCIFVCNASCRIGSRLAAYEDEKFIDLGSCLGVLERFISVCNSFQKPYLHRQMWSVPNELKKMKIVVFGFR